jgi:hypothetical protein
MLIVFVVGGSAFAGRIIYIGSFDGWGQKDGEVWIFFTFIPPPPLPPNKMTTNITDQPDETIECILGNKGACGPHWSR